MSIVIGGRPAERVQESGDGWRQAGQVTQGAPVTQDAASGSATATSIP